MSGQRFEYRIGSERAPVLNDFMGCRERVSIVIGPLGSGKTYGALQRLLAQMQEQAPNDQGIRPSRWLAIRNTYLDLSETTMKDFMSVFEGLGTMRYGGLEPPNFQLVARLEDGSRVESEVIFLALDRDDSVRKLRGYQITGAWLNETKELVKSVVDMADLRHGRYPTRAAGGVQCSWHGMFGDTNAPDEDHWLYRVAEEERPEGWCVFKQPGGLQRDGEEWVENPAAENVENLPARYYMAGKAAKAEDWIRVNLGNEYGFVREGKPVYPQFLDSTHVSRELIEADPRYPLIVGVDFGRTPAALVTQYIEPLGRWVGIDELVTENMSAAIFAPELKRWLAHHWPGFTIRAWGDPAGDASGETVETTPIEILRSEGIPIQPAPSNVTTLRRAALAKPMLRLCMDGKPAFQLSPKCRITRKGLAGGFCYRKLKVAGEERFTEHPDKNMYSHPVEALEYALLGGGEGAAALRPATIRTGGRRQQMADL